MKLIVDMNLSPEWTGHLQAAGWTATHWRDVGPETAPDDTILKWAKENESIVLTQDLDFAQLLFALKDDGPSVILLRMPDVLDEACHPHILHAISQAEVSLNTGALLVISPDKARIRKLPIE